jgi:CheY-like chemotaxis protein
MHTCIVTKWEQHGADRPDEGGVVAAWKIGAANRSGEERVADKEIARRLSPLADLQAHAAGTVAGCVVWPNVTLSELDHFAGRVVHVDRRQRLGDLQPEHARLIGRAIVEKLIVGVQVDRNVEGAFGDADAGHVIDVRVREQNSRQLNVLALRILEQRSHFISRIDDDAVERVRAGDHKTVLEEGTDRLALDYDHPVILAIVDDLMFTSKIRAAAKPLGVTVSFARSAQAALDSMRAQSPALAIFDLDNPRTDPIATLVAMREDEALCRIPTIGFVSHVHAHLIDAARGAGITEVMARSAFTAKLPEILSRDSAS